MICKVCNTDNKPGAVFCENCGATLEQAPVTCDVETTVPATDPGKTLNLISLILGIASLALGIICSCITCGGILPSLLGVAAIVLGAIGMKKSKSAGFSGKMGMIGLILGIAGVVIVTLLGIIIAVLGGIGQIMGATSESYASGYYG